MSDDRATPNNGQVSVGEIVQELWSIWHVGAGNPLVRANLIRDAAHALTAERDRADKADRTATRFEQDFLTEQFDARRLADRLAIETDRADRAEARIYNSPHDSKCKFPALGWNCTCWKFEATA